MVEKRISVDSLELRVASFPASLGEMRLSSSEAIAILQYGALLK